MEKLKEFFYRRCEVQSDINTDLVLLQTDFEKIKIHVEDEQYSNLRYLKLERLVRFLNPKVNLTTTIKPEIENIIDDDDFDIGIEEVNEMEIPMTREMIIGSEELLHLYFLPWHIERMLKNITCGSKRKNIDSRLKQIIPDNYIEHMELSFKEKQNEIIIEYDQRQKHAVSFFKFFRDDEGNECETIEEVEIKVNQVKYDLGLKFVESMDYYFIGDIASEIGLLERDVTESNKNPLYYHFNFWKLSDVISDGIWADFDLYPFSKEVLENAN